MLAVHTVGAGGGSIAWRDAGGALRVGPRSAGADPGPACYGRGGTEPTVTDANLVLGYSRPGRARWPAASRSTATPPSDAVGAARRRLGLERLELRRRDRARRQRRDGARAARGDRRARHRPARYALLAFGGAGPLHAAADRRRARDRRVLVRAPAGVLAALGLVVAPRRRDAQRSVFLAGAGARRRTHRRARQASSASRPGGHSAPSAPSCARPTSSATAASRSSCRSRRHRARDPTRCEPRSRPSTRTATATATPTRRSSSSRSASPPRCRASTSPLAGAEDAAEVERSRRQATLGG